MTTYNPGDHIDGGAGDNTLQITNANNGTLNVYSADITNIQNLVVKNYDSNFEYLNVNGAAIKNVTLDYANTYQYYDAYVSGLDAQASLTVQGISASDDSYVYRNYDEAWSSATGAVSVSNTFKNIDVSGAVNVGSAYSSGASDAKFEGYEYFDKATTINHTLNVANVKGADNGSNDGYGIYVYDNIGSNQDGAVVNSTINIDNVITTGSGDYNGHVEVYGFNNAGTSTVSIRRTHLPPTA